MTMLSRKLLQNIARIDWFTSFLLLVYVTYLLSSCHVADETSGDRLVIDSAYLRQMASFDRDVGTIYIFLKNMSNLTVEVQDATINDIPLSSQSEFLWYRINPHPIPPKQISELVVQLREHDSFIQQIRPFLGLPSHDAILRSEEAILRFVTALGEKIEVPIAMTNHPFYFTFIAFSDALDTIYLYIKNDGQKNLTLKEIFLSTEDVTRNCRIPVREINKNELRLAVINLDKPLIRGQYVTVKVTTKQGIIAQSRVRVFSDFYLRGSDFHLGGLDKKGSLELFMDAARFDLPKDEKNSHELFHHLLDCPMHSGDNHTVEAMLTNARTILTKMEETRESTFLMPRYIHVCRADIYSGCAKFGQIADLIRINPSVALLPSFRYNLPDDTDETPVQYLTAFAKNASQPRPLHTTISVTSSKESSLNPIPELERLLVYAAVSSGSKGIFYRIWGTSLNANLKQEIKKINGELQILKRYLKFGEPMPLATCAHSDVEASTILAGDKAIVLILIDTNPIDSEKTVDGIRAPFSPKLDFEVTVHTPRWMQIKDVYEVGEDFGRPKYRKRGNQIVIKVDRLNFTKQIVLTTRADDYDHDQDQDGISDIDEIAVHDTHPAIPNLHPTLQVATD